MVYDIPEWIPQRVELWFLANVIRRSSSEGMLYRELSRLEHVLSNGASIEELRACRDEQVPKAYVEYQTKIKTDFMPYFHQRITSLKVALNARVSKTEERKDLQEGYVGSRN